MFITSTGITRANREICGIENFPDFKFYISTTKYFKFVSVYLFLRIAG
jgi:hypothetical protein